MKERTLKTENGSNTVNGAALEAGKPTRRVTGTTLKPVGISDLDGVDGPITFLIDGYMEHGTFNSIIAAPKAGKSMYALQMATAVQNGIDFLGYKTEKHHVLYVDFELQPNHIKQRFESVKKHYNMPDAEEPQFLSVYDDFSAGRIHMGDIITSVRNALARDPDIKLVFFDCFYTFCEGARNQEGNVKAQLMPLKSIAADYGVSVCYVHHTSKAGLPKDPDQNDIINAAGGSGIHGKIVDTTYVIYPVYKSNTYFNIASMGRAIHPETAQYERSNETYNCFCSLGDDTQEVVEIDTDLRKLIIDFMETSDCSDDRTIRSKFNVSKQALKDMGFSVNTKQHIVTAPKVLPSEGEAA